MYVYDSSNAYVNLVFGYMQTSQDRNIISMETSYIFEIFFINKITQNKIKAGI